MRIVNNHISYSIDEISAAKYHNQRNTKESDSCPFCGKKLSRLKKTNILVCKNPQCANTVYELVR